VAFGKPTANMSAKGPILVAVRLSCRRFIPPRSGTPQVRNLGAQYLLQLPVHHPIYRSASRA
jgi:hypothetical protein